MITEQPDHFANYRSLVAKVDAHWEKVAASHPLHCARGCTACCHVSLSVSRVEADHILRGPPIRLETPGPGPLDGHPLFARLAGPTPCVFLTARGDCAIYHRRPLICRSHGLPVRVDGRVDACPLHGELEAPPVLSLEVLNTTLAAIDGLYCQQRGLSATRIPLLELAKALSQDP